jgi:mono/diheme cytochrome c family protein
MEHSQSAEPKIVDTEQIALHPHSRQFRQLIAIILLVLLVFIGLGYQAELVLPVRPPTLSNTFTPLTQATPSQVGSYDVLGKAITPNEAEPLLKTEAGRTQLSPEQGAVQVTDELIHLGRDAFYRETFGNERFITDVVGALNGPINLVTLTKAIARLGGKATANLQVPIDKDVVIGGREFKAGTFLNTGLDVPARSLLPLGMRTTVSQGKVRVGITCAACHASLDRQTGRILEGAPNNDLDTGLILAFASNSAAMFRHTGVNPLQFPSGNHTYINIKNQKVQLPDAKAIEDAVDADLLSWAPGNFDSTGTLSNNPSQTPSSYTFDAYPYGWSGHSAIGWFHGLTTLNSNVHATNSDATTGADGSQATLGIDKETYLGVVLQNAASLAFRLPPETKPSEFFDQVDPTPGEPAINAVIRMPGYPKGSAFMLDGLMANSPGMPVGQQLNGLSAWQNTLAPPPVPEPQDPNALQQGAKVFNQAGCAECHSGRRFTNHTVVSQRKVGTQPSRAEALTALAQSFVAPQTYPNSASVPLSSQVPTLEVPTDITPKADQQRAFALGDRSGGYKVPSLIGVAVTAPYLHDGGVAASSEALKAGEDGFEVVDTHQLGMAGTLMQNIIPDPDASLRLLLDRRLRQPMVVANRANPDLQRSNIDGSGHSYWVDKAAGFTPQDQTALIQFLLSLDDDPTLLPN